jgi:GTP cyclohydrolase I
MPVKNSRRQGARASDGEDALAALASRYRDILVGIGEDPGREGLLKTPARAAKAISELTSGYLADIPAMFNGAVFKENYNEMVLVKNITFYSLCEHHLLPFFGSAHVAYIPDGRIIGLSKIPKLVDVFAKRLQVQERMTYQIAETLEGYLTPLGVGVVIEARHLCMEMRGAESIHSPTVTSKMRGVFAKDVRTREEFLKLIR